MLVWSREWGDSQAPAEFLQRLVTEAGSAVKYNHAVNNAASIFFAPLGLPKKCLGKLFSGGRCLICRCVLQRDMQAAHVYRNGKGDRKPPVEEVPDRFEKDELVYLCSACHFAYDGAKGGNIRYEDGREFGIYDLVRRFRRVKEAIGSALVAEYLERREADGTPTSSGAFVQICAEVLDAHHAEIVGVFDGLEALVPIRAGCGDGQTTALKKIAEKNPKCSADSCSTPGCPYRYRPFTPCALEIDSKSDQHHRVYNNFLKLDGGEWVFVDNESRKKDTPGEAFVIGEEGEFEKIEGVTFTPMGDKKWEVQGGGKVTTVLGGFWQTLVTHRNIPDAFFLDLQIACRGCNSAKSLPSSDDVQRVVRFLAAFRKVHDAQKAAGMRPKKADEYTRFAEARNQWKWQFLPNTPKARADVCAELNLEPNFLESLRPKTHGNVGNWREGGRLCVSNSRDHLKRCQHKIKLGEKDGRRFWAAYVEVKEAGAEKEDRTARIACIRADCNPTDRPPAPPAEPADTKECKGKCNEWKPLTDFGVRTDNKNGVSRPKSCCKACCSENERARKRKRKLEEENLGRGPSATKQKRG